MHASRPGYPDYYLTKHMNLALIASVCFYQSPVLPVFITGHCVIIVTILVRGFYWN